MTLFAGMRGIVFFFAVYVVIRLSTGDSLSSLLQPNDREGDNEASNGGSRRTTAAPRRPGTSPAGTGHRLGGD